MGFLDSLLSVGTTVLGAATPFIPAVQAVTTALDVASALGAGGEDQAERIISRAGTATETIPSRLSGTVAQLGGAAATAQLQAIQAAGGQVVGRRKNRVTTIIETTDGAGNVVRQRVEKGSPFLMRSDFQTVKKVMRLARIAAGLLPAKTGRKAKLEAEALKGFVKGLGAAQKQITVIDTE